MYYLRRKLKYCCKGIIAACLAAALNLWFFFLTAIIFTEKLGTYKNTKALQELKVLDLYCADLKRKMACETKRVTLLWCVTS